MPTTQSVVFARTHGWYVSENYVFGLYRGRYCQIEDVAKTDSDSKTVFVFRFETGEAELKQLRNEVERREKFIGYKTLETEADVLILLFTKSLIKELKPAEWTRVLDEVIDQAEKLGLPSHPAAESQAERYGFYQVNGNGALLSTDEYEELRNAAGRANRQTELENVSYLRGALGGLVAMLPGVAVWILLAVYAERVFVILAAGIGFLAYWGYNYAKGKQGPGTVWIVAALTLLGVLLSTVGTTVFYMTREGFGYTESLWFLFSDRNTMLEFAKANMISLGIGVVAAFFIARAVDVRGDRVEPAERA